MLFAERGFDGVTMRDIADAAERPLGVVGYHFESKDDLWRAAATTVHQSILDHLGRRLDGLHGVDMRTSARLVLRDFVHYFATHPQMFRFIIQNGFADSERLRWYVRTLSMPFRRRFAGVFAEISRQNKIKDERDFAIFLYTLLGACTLLHAQAPEVKLMTGISPAAPDVIESHAEMVIRLFLPAEQAAEVKVKKSTRAG